MFWSKRAHSAGSKTRPQASFGGRLGLILVAVNAFVLAAAAAGYGAQEETHNQKKGQSLHAVYRRAKKKQAGPGLSGAGIRTFSTASPSPSPCPLSFRLPAGSLSSWPRRHSLL